MEEELCRLRSQAELHRMQTTVIATLEGERAALERDRDALRSTVDAMRAAQRKVGECTCTNTHKMFPQTQQMSLYYREHRRGADAKKMQAYEKNPVFAYCVISLNNYIITDQIFFLSSSLETNYITVRSKCSAEALSCM